jgi:hypothetical protein
MVLQQLQGQAVPLAVQEQQEEILDLGRLMLQAKILLMAVLAVLVLVGQEVTVQTR